MTVQVVMMQGGKSTAKALTATALFFSGIDSIALTPQTVTPSGGVAPYTFAAVNFPAGVSVAAGTGIVSGTPTTPGVTTNASVTVTDSALHTFSVPIFFNIFQGTFADSFARADQPFFVGDAWGFGIMETSTSSGPSIPANINVAGNALNLGLTSTNGQNQLFLYPIQVDWPQVSSGHAQYSQCKISADNSGGTSFGFTGPGAMFNVNRCTGYFISTNVIIGVGNSVGKYTVASWNGGGAETSINNNGGAGFSFAINDVLRIEVYPNTPVANQTTIKSFKNGVQQSSDVDATNHYDNGVYGIYDFFTSAGITQSWQLFQGGILT